MEKLLEKMLKISHLNGLDINLERVIITFNHGSSLFTTNLGRY